MKKILLLLLLFPLLVEAQWKLSETAEIHIITCGPYQGELYSAFGHSAIRVKDPEKGLDLLYNYGVFDFNQKHFYLNFARGYLYYRLAVMRYPDFRDSYIAENRYIHEQVLNLDHQQKQKLFDFLQWNSQPENMGYYYDYFYDNCATRVRDAVKQTFGDTVHFDGSYIDTDYSIRDLCDLYLVHQPWGDLGIDLCLGLPMDKKAEPYEYMFLPDYIETGFRNATILQNGKQQPLVKDTIITYRPRPETLETNFITPFVVFIILLILGLWITHRGYKKRKSFFWFDSILLSAIGLIGWLLIFLWFFTNHAAAANNFNLLWAMPLYFPLALVLLKRRKPSFLVWFFRVMAVIHLLTLIAWAFLLQDLHHAFIPLVILLLVRAIYIQQYLVRQRSAQEIR